MLHVRDHDTIRVWTIDRPHTKNALDFEALAALRAAVTDASADPRLRAIVITGAGGTFVSGGDLRELRHRTSPQDAARLTDEGFDLLQAIGALSVPVIAAISGAAMGGGAELALACDLRVADSTTRIAFRQTHMGVTTAWGSTERLLHLTSGAVASRLLLWGIEVNGHEAMRIGLVDALSVSGTALETALEWAHALNATSPSAVAATKDLLRAPSRERERSAFVDAWTGQDHAEAVEAYFERRAPRWSPRRTS